MAVDHLTGTTTGTVEEVVRHQLATALGGRRGMLEAAVPTAGFTVLFLTTHDLRVSLLIAVFTLACAVFALALADHDSGGTTMSLIALVPGLLFLARGIAGYLPAWRQAHPEEPFRTNDLRVYSPLCLIVGVGFIVLALLRMA